MTVRHWLYSSAAVIVVAAVFVLRARREDKNKTAGDTASRNLSASSTTRGPQKPLAGDPRQSAGGDKPRAPVIRKAPPPEDLASAYISEGKRAILADGTFDPEFWTAFGFTPEQREVTQKRWDRQLWIASFAEKRFMSEPLTAGASVTFTIEPSPDTGAAVRKKLLEDFATMMPANAVQYLASQGGLGEGDPVFGASGRNRREFQVTQSGGRLQVHEKQYACDATAGWILVLDVTNSFQGIPPRFANLFEEEKH